MPLPPRIARPLYKALLTAARGLDHELTRCTALRARELDTLRQSAAAPLPRELRGLLDVRFSTAAPALLLHTDQHQQQRQRPSALSPSALASPSTNVTRAYVPHIFDYVRICARRVAEAATAPDLTTVDATVGFKALRHLNSRVEVLRHLVYTTSSDAERYGIRVMAESSFQGADKNRFFFRYQVRIFNTSEATVKLISRDWTIRDLDGRITSVQGPGVVGAFPTLAPSEAYEYSSAVPLPTPLGSQSGHYMFVTLKPEPSARTDARHKMLQVPVAPFSYRSPSMDGRPADKLFANSVAATGSKASRRRKRSEEGRRR